TADDVKVAATLKQNGYVNAVAFTPDGEYLFTAGSDFQPAVVKGQTLNGRVKRWHVAKGKEEAGPPAFPHTIEGTALSPDGKYLAVSTGGYLLGSPTRPTLAEPGELQLLDCATCKQTANLKSGAFSYQCLAFSPDSKMLAGGSSPQDNRGMPMTPGG